MSDGEQQDGLLHNGTAEITRLGKEAVALAVEEHRRLGNPIAVWRDGKVVWLPPEEIPPYAPPSSDTPTG